MYESCVAELCKPVNYNNGFSAPRYMVLGIIFIVFFIMTFACVYRLKEQSMKQEYLVEPVYADDSPFKYSKAKIELMNGLKLGLDSKYQKGGFDIV